jgi:hypothetical protein
VYGIAWEAILAGAIKTGEAALLPSFRQTTGAFLRSGLAYDPASRELDKLDALHLHRSGESVRARRPIGGTVQTVRALAADAKSVGSHMGRRCALAGT